MCAALPRCSFCDACPLTMLKRAPKVARAPCCGQPLGSGPIHGCIALVCPYPQVAKEDVELVAQQFDLDKKKAERCLREAKGDVKAALRTLLSV